jgi:hypothetical protein
VQRLSLRWAKRKFDFRFFKNEKLIESLLKGVLFYLPNEQKN